MTGKKALFYLKLNSSYLLFILALLNPICLQAADLMDIFRSARDHDPNWAAQQLKFEMEQQGLAAAEAALYPQIAASVVAKDIKTSGTGAALINPVYLDDELLLDCFIQIRQNDSCSPSLVIRDDAGGRYDTYDASIQLKQPLYNYTLWRNYNKAKILNEQNTSSFEHAKQDLILRVAEAYFAVLRAYEEWELSKTETESAEKQLEQVKKRYQLGLTAQNDVYDVRAARDSSRVKLLVAKTALENAQEDLMLSTQRRDVSLARLSNNIVIEAPQPYNVEEWVKLGLKNNRSLIASHSTRLAAEQELASKRGGYHPEINLLAGYNSTKNDIVAVESAPSIQKSGIGVQLVYHVYRGGLTTAEVKGAKLSLQRSEELFESTRRDVIRNVRNSFRQVVNDVRGVEAAEQSVHSRERSLEASEAGYANGTRPLITVLTAQTDLFRARKEYANARYNFIIDSLKLKYEAGTLAIEDLQVVNSWLESDQLILPPQLESQEEVEVDLFY